MISKRALISLLSVVIACTPPPDYTTIRNTSANVPPQCYTKTFVSDTRRANPCYVCHQEAIPPNYSASEGFQMVYDFIPPARKNPWTNLFRDNSEFVRQVSDARILEYIRSDNYRNSAGEKVFERLRESAPAAWDINKNGKWDGVIPDIEFSFDREGFDRRADNSPTGWRAYAYYPFPGTFWPANGSVNDVFIRLPLPYRLNEKGQPDQDAYRINLAIVEALIKRADVRIPPADEKRWNSDLDGNGALGTASVVRFARLIKPAISHSGTGQFVGAVRKLPDEFKPHVHPGLFPPGTEFLHTVRYIDPDNTGGGLLSVRLKELRYARKTKYLTDEDLRNVAQAEAKEEYDKPEAPSKYFGNAETGLANGQGWIYSAFIEDISGDLRPQTAEELTFCMGCHSALGATHDGNFSFARKFGGSALSYGWYHWSQLSLRGEPEPVRAEDNLGEYSFYLTQNFAGDEFRANGEIIRNFFRPEGTPDPARLQAQSVDVTQLLWPSRSRALALNKAYLRVVREQSFIRGRDAILEPPLNVHHEVSEGLATEVTYIRHNRIRP